MCRFSKEANQESDFPYSLLPDPSIIHIKPTDNSDCLGVSRMNFTALLNAMPGAVAQGLIWGIMAIGVYITYKVLDLADLTVDGSRPPAARCA